MVQKIVAGFISIALDLDDVPNKVSMICNHLMELNCPILGIASWTQHLDKVGCVYIYYQHPNNEEWLDQIIDYLRLIADTPQVQVNEPPPPPELP